MFPFSYQKIVVWFLTFIAVPLALTTMYFIIATYDHTLVYLFFWSFAISTQVFVLAIYRVWRD